MQGIFIECSNFIAEIYDEALSISWKRACLGEHMFDDDVSFLCIYREVFLRILQGNERVFLPVR